MLAAIVARAQNGAIGGDNQLLWRLPEDLRYFKEKTSGHVIIMGRKTFESLPFLLPNREHWVITRQQGYAREGIRVFTSVEEACEAAKLLPVKSDGISAFVIGGAQVYAASMPYVDRLYVTEVHADFEGDAFFPSIPDDFEKIAHSGAQTTELQPWTYAFVVYERHYKG